MRMDLTSRYIQRFVNCYDDFKLELKGGRVLISAGGLVYDGSAFTIDEALEEAFMFIRSRTLAAELVKTAVVSLP